MSAEPQYTGPESETGIPAALGLSAVKERRLRVVGAAEVREEHQHASDGARPPRRPLSAQPAARPRRKVPWIVAGLLGVMLALGMALMVNIHISANQYDLVGLRSEERDLTEQNQALSQEIEYAQAPQNLAIRASQLGMVASENQAQLDLRDDSLSGTPTAAQAASDDRKEAAENGQTNLIDPPRDSDTEAAKTAEKRAKEQAAKDEEAQQRADDAKAAQEKAKDQTDGGGASQGASSTSQSSHGQGTGTQQNSTQQNSNQ